MRIQGAVVNQNTGKPISNAQVWELYPDGQQAIVIGKTDYAGRYDVDVVNAGSTVNFSSDGYISTAMPLAQAAASDQILLPPDGSITASFKLSGLPSWLLAEIKHLASLHNPLFYERQRLRLSTFRTPRFIKCYEEDLARIHLPRGVLGRLTEIVGRAGSKLAVTDARKRPEPCSFAFRGTLTPLQQDAVTKLLADELGVLVAPPGTGKTVMGCAVIAARNLPTLVLVHRQPLLDQWRLQLTTLLALSPDQLGQIGGGKRKPTGIIDLVMIQSLKATSDLEAFFGAVFERR